MVVYSNVGAIIKNYWGRKRLEGDPLEKVGGLLPPASSCLSLSRGTLGDFLGYSWWLAVPHSSAHLLGICCNLRCDHFGVELLLSSCSDRSVVFWREGRAKLSLSPFQVPDTLRALTIHLTRERLRGWGCRPLCSQKPAHNFWLPPHLTTISLLLILWW